MPGSDYSPTLVTTRLSVLEMEITAKTRAHKTLVPMHSESPWSL